MSLSIKKVAEETGLTEYTLRYYEKRSFWDPLEEMKLEEEYMMKRIWR